MDPNRLLISLLVVVVAGHVVSLDVAGQSEAQVLRDLKKSLRNNGALYNWALDPSRPPCPGGRKSNWVGIVCSKGAVFGLQLENMSLTGQLDANMLKALPGLRTVSFKNNSLGGPMLDFRNLGPMRAVFLSDNQFSGDIPADAFAGMDSLRKVHLSRNNFSGLIPVSLTEPSKLVELGLEENQFVGGIPDFPQKNLKLNVSYNQLEGPIPAHLSSMSNTTFIGNKNLCGAPLDIACKPPSKKSKISHTLLIIIIIAAAVLLALLVAIFILFSHRRRKRPLLDIPPTDQRKMAARDRELMEEQRKVGAKDQEPEKLVFVGEGRETFELNDMLRASAEVLGDGSFGPSYKAVLLSGPAMVVKRLKDMNGVGREEFQEHMRRLGRLKHPNLLPLVAFYYKKEEKLLVSDYVPGGSLAQLLHGTRNSNRRALDWPVRLKIVKGVAKGLAYLHKEFPSQIIPHGHLKSSNVLLDESFEPLLVDYALAPLINKDQATKCMVAYKSPEFIQYGRTSKRSDVWSLGILILEILTGRFPASNHRQKKGSGDLASWVNSVVREEWTGEVFDSDLERTRNGEGEMLKLLRIGLGCCERDVDKRWKLREALERIEELRERGMSEDDYSSNASEGTMDCSKGMTEEDFSFSMNV